MKIGSLLVSIKQLLFSQTITLLNLCLILSTYFVACDEEVVTLNSTINAVPDPSCSGFFGETNERSGLDENQCSTSCLCAEEDRSFARPELESALFTYANVTSMTLLGHNPYMMSLASSSQDEYPATQACIIDVNHTEQSYRLNTVALNEARSANITHLGPCGACSSMRDLKVYLEHIDLTDPVRTCGLAGISSGIETTTQCLQELGFSSACAEIWAYNTQHTRENCLQVCLSNLNTSYVTPSGKLNPCLACDEELSGPIFKQIAGRTRRNSGLASAICRPCNTVSLVFHSYLSFDE
jgi:hypothetical protein